MEDKEFEKIVQEKDNTIKELKTELGRLSKLDEEHGQAVKQIEELKAKIKEAEDKQRASELETYAKTLFKESEVNESLFDFIKPQAEDTAEAIKKRVERLANVQKSIEQTLLEKYSEISSGNGKGQKEKKESSGLISKILEEATKKKEFKF